MEEEGGGPLLRASAERTAAEAPAKAAAPESPAPTATLRFLILPQNPAPPPSARRGRRRVTAAPRGPEAPFAAGRQPRPCRPPGEGQLDRWTALLASGRARACRFPRPGSGQRGALTPGGPGLHEALWREVRH